MEATCPEDLDFDGVVGVNDLMELLSAFGTDCPEPEGPATSEFTCGDPVSYHGYDYATVQIGEQCWFAEDLRTMSFSEDSAIPEVVQSSSWENTTSPARFEIPRCVNETESDDFSGMLYNGYCVRDVRGLCPSGWSIPSDEDWQELEIELGMDPVVAAQSSESGVGRGTDQGKQLKAGPDGLLNWNGDDIWGFNVVPGGTRSANGNFLQACNKANFWSSTLYNSDRNFERRFHSAYDGIGRQHSDLTEGWSVRCIHVIN